jgi:oligo-1,6-glucosidase
LVGETSNITPEIGNEFLKNEELDMFFEFDHSMCDMNGFVPIFKKKFKAKNLINPMIKWQNAVPWIGVYLENHDQRRSLTRYGNEEKYYKESAKALSMFLLSLKGTPFIYQGEEIGMVDLKNNTIDDLDDCLAKSAIDSAHKLLKISKKKAFNMVNKTVNRDHARTPFQWDSSVNAGFNKGAKPWLLINSNYEDGINVEDESKDPNSILNFYKEMIKLRNENDTLKFGTFTRVKSNKNVAKFIRESDDEELLVVVNLSDKTIKDIRNEGEVLGMIYNEHIYLKKKEEQYKKNRS